MPSILGFGFVDPDKFFTTLKTQRPHMIARGVTMAFWPLAEQLIKNQMGNFGFFK